MRGGQVSMTRLAATLERARQLFAYPFRIFFLSAAVLAVLAIPAWLAMVLAGWQPPLALTPLQWHQHEMLFGFLEAAIAGFLLTAVCAWTGTERLHGTQLGALWSVWFVARLLVLSPLPAWLVASVDLAFLPLVMLDAGRRIVSSRQYRQSPILLVLALLWSMDAAFHASADTRFVYGALVMAMTLMLVIGGRITPAFSGNWLRLNGGDPSAIRVVPMLEHLVLPIMLSLLAAVVLQLDAGIRMVLALAASAISSIRILLWQGWRTRAEPLLWILHLALLWIPVSLFLMAGNAAGWASSSAWVHAASAGAMGSLILGVTSRVALGHTGRPLRVGALIAVAFVVILAAGIVRVATALGMVDWQLGLVVAACLWTAAFTAFLLHYAPILATPRVDGKEG